MALSASALLASALLRLLATSALLAALLALSALASSASVGLSAISALLALVASVDGLLVPGKKCGTPKTLTRYKIVLQQPY
jgi:hypothetical protein